MEQKLILFWHRLLEVWQHSLLSSPQWCETHTFLLSVSFLAGIPHTPHMNLYTHTHTHTHTHTLLSLFFSSAPRDCKNIRPAVEGARDGERVKERMVGKESTDFNSQNSSGRPPGMEGWGERERGRREGRKDVSRYYYHCHKQAWGATHPPPPTPTDTYTHTHTHTHTHIRTVTQACIQVCCRDTQTHTHILSPKLNTTTVTVWNNTESKAVWRRGSCRGPGRGVTRSLDVFSGCKVGRVGVNLSELLWMLAAIKQEEEEEEE